MTNTTRGIVLAISLLGAMPVTAQMQGLWTVTGASQDARLWNAQVALGSGAMLVGGTVDGITMLTSAQIYSSKTGLWTFTGSMATGRELFPAVVLQDGKV